jgi:hypothetical protein
MKRKDKGKRKEQCTVPTVPATQYPGMMIIFFSSGHHFLKICRLSPQHKEKYIRGETVNSILNNFEVCSSQEKSATG